MPRTELDYELGAVDRLLGRWAPYALSEANLGRTLHPIARAIIQAEGAALPGAPPEMPDDVLAVDRVIAKAPAAVKFVIQIWYCTGGSSAQKAKRLNCSRAMVYQLWNGALRYVQGAYERCAA